METAKNRRRRGRPSSLTAELADAIVAEISAGSTLGEAARACGVGSRTLRTWRRRAWSPREVDAPYVVLEKRVQRALRKSSPLDAQSMSWKEAAARLEVEHPERWALPDLDDVLAELE